MQASPIRDVHPEGSVPTASNMSDDDAHRVVRELELPPRSIAVVLGTRPELIKLAGIVELLGPAGRLIHTGQHFSDVMSDHFLSELGMPRPELHLEVGGLSRGEQISQGLAAIEHHISMDPPRALVVQGDTNSVLAGALAANARSIPLAHVEAGLRSHDRAMPEEHNRVLTDHLADLCLAPTRHAAENLSAEGISTDRIRVTGNTVVEAVHRLLPTSEERAKARRELGDLPISAYVLATLHRPENVDNPETLRHILDLLASLELPVVLPMHPRTEARVESFGLGHLLEGLYVLPPVGYRQFLALAADCALVISDSGGIQEESSVLKRPVLVVRNSTERPEVLGSFSRLVKPGSDLRQATETALQDVAKTHTALAEIPTPYGDGKASFACVNAIAELVQS